MQVELIDQLAKPTDGCAGDLDLLECASSTSPVIAVADRSGLARMSTLGINPVACVTPSPVVKWQTKHVLEKAFKRVGATKVVCRSEWSLRLAATISGVHPVRPETPSGSCQCRISRQQVREQLGLQESHKLIVPLANHPGEIDALVLALCASAMSIAEHPIVTLIPSRAGHVRRARAFLANADRVLNAIATEVPTAAYLAAADAIIWGPHIVGADADRNAIRTIRWARSFGVPVLCTAPQIDALEIDDASGKLYVCAGTSAADLASPLLEIFNPDS